MNELIDLYMDAKQNAWTAATLKSERARLNQVAHLLDKGPDALYQALSHKAPYTIKTTFTRVSALFTWALGKGLVTSDLYGQWIQENKRIFKNAYKTHLPTISYNEAKARITSLPCKKTAEKAMQLLHGGLRWSESFTISGGQCLGKGEKYRSVFVGPVDYPYSYSYFRNHLRTIGLKPHDLRKIRATEIARELQSPADLCKIFGWESFETASKYLAPLKDEQLKEIMK